MQIRRVLSRGSAFNKHGFAALFAIILALAAQYRPLATLTKHENGGYRPKRSGLAEMPAPVLDY